MKVWTELKGILGDLKFGLKRFIKYQICTKVIIAMLLLPLIKVILNGLMYTKGISYLSNGVILKYLITPQGILSFLIMCIFAVFVIVIEIGGLIVISHQSTARDEESSFLEIAKYCLSKSKRFLGFDGLIVILFFMIIFPWLNMDMHTSIISNIKIPGFVQDVIDASMLYSSILLLVTIVLLILASRFTFTLHNIMLRDMKSKEALKYSNKLVATNWKSLFKKNFLTVMALFLTLILSMCVICIVLALLYAAGQAVGLPVSVLESGIMGIVLVIIFLGSFIVMPVFIIYFTRVYERICDTKIQLKLKSKVYRNNFLTKTLNNKLILGISFVIAVAVAGLSFFTMKSMEGAKYDVKITAHRGSSIDAPENTIAAINVAAKNGADYAEIDIQETKDHELILLHDKSFKRTTGLDEEPHDLTLKEIKELDAGEWFSEEFKGEQVPTLDEIIKASKGKIKLNIEIKPTEYDTQLIEKMIQTIEKNNFIDQCVVTSLNYDVLQQVEALQPKIKTGYVMFMIIGKLEDLNIDFYSLEETQISEEVIEKAHLLGREVHAWTINTTDSMDSMINIGVDNIITDQDKVLRQKINELKEEHKNLMKEWRINQKKSS